MHVGWIKPTTHPAQDHQGSPLITLILTCLVSLELLQHLSTYNITFWTAVIWVHGWRSLEGCSPWGRWGSDTTDRLHFHFSLSCIGEGHCNPLQCSCLEKPRDGGAWWAAVYGVAQSRTRLKWLSSSSSISHYVSFTFDTSISIPRGLRTDPITRRYLVSIWSNIWKNVHKKGVEQPFHSIDSDLS